MGSINAEARSSGSPSEVWALLADARQWSQWGPWSKVEVEGGGEQGLGSIRVLDRWPFHIRERVTEWEPDERMGYELLDGMRVRGYTAVVTLSPAGDGGTVVRWSSRYDSADPITALLLRTAIRDACRRVAKAASTR